jgi:chitinase
VCQVRPSSESRTLPVIRPPFPMLATRFWVPMMGTLLVILKPVAAFRRSLDIRPGQPILNDLCPTSCYQAGPNPANWDVFSGTDRLKLCQNAMLFDFAIYTPLTEKQAIRACTIWGAEFNGTVKADPEEALRQVPEHSTNETVDLHLESWGLQATPVHLDAVDPDAADAATLLLSVQQYMENTLPAYNVTIFFASRRNTNIGIYIGKAVSTSGIAKGLLEPLRSQLLLSGLRETVAVQLCGTNKTAHGTPDQAAGVLVTKDLLKVQSALQAWANGTCVQESTSSTPLGNITLTIAAPLDTPLLGITNMTLSNSTVLGKRGHFVARATLSRRAECRTVRVAHGDGCAELAKKCGLSGDAFTRINKAKKDLCSTLMDEQEVGCTEGTLPDRRPKPNADGSCATYETVPDDNCSKIGARLGGLTVADLESFNKKTWGMYISTILPDK